MHSMTGFGRGTAPLGEGRLVIEMRSVNHRFLEIRTRAPRELLAAEPLLDKLIRGSLSRGHLSANISFESAGGPPARIDKTALESHLDDLAPIAKKKGVSLGELAVVLVQAPNIYAMSSSVDDDALTHALTEAFEDSIDRLVQMRAAEGAAMETDIRSKLSSIRETLDQIRGLAEDFPESALQKARARISDLLSNNGLDLDPSRIEAEAALLADRADVNEEITRLFSHCDQMTSHLDSSDPVGRRLEFLVQEMGREANTIGAKSAISQVTHLVVEIKAQLEKIRELAQNVE